MKKMFARLLCAVFIAAACLTAFVGCTPRERKLRIYNWGEYMDETVVSSFVEWYEQEYGEKIKVQYKEFASNEDVYTAIAKRGETWDLICPSEYMVERMIKEELLQAVDKDVVDVSKEGFMEENLLEIIDAYDPSLTYSVPYIWGTFGIMYDTTAFTDAQKQKMNSWAALWDEEFSGKIYMKDQARDSYAVATLYLNRDALSTASNGFTNYETPAYTDLIDKIFTEYTVPKVNAAKDVLIEQKKLLARYESDEGKMELADGSGEGKMGLFWSCDAGFAMNDYEAANAMCSSDSTLEGNKDLAYVVPKEGSNVWVDSWVIPATAENPRLANLFLKYIMQKDVCILNASYAGAPSANKEAMQELEEEIKEDDEFFASAPAGFKDMYLQMMFPPADVLLRCRAMSDFGDEFKDIMTQMWQDVKAAQK